MLNTSSVIVWAVKSIRKFQKSLWSHPTICWQKWLKLKSLQIVQITKSKCQDLLTTKVQTNCWSFVTVFRSLVEFLCASDIQSSKQPIDWFLFSTLVMMAFFCTKATTRKTILWWNTFWIKIRFPFVGITDKGRKSRSQWLFHWLHPMIFHGFDIFHFFFSKKNPSRP